MGSLNVCKCLWLCNNKLLLQIYVSKVMILFLNLLAPFLNKSEDNGEILSVSKHEIHLNSRISLYDRPSVGSLIQSVI
jgi:hypothetical protein